MPKRGGYTGNERTADDLINDLQVLNFSAPDDDVMRYESCTGYVITVSVDRSNWRRSRLNYGPEIQVHHASACNFRQSETLVVLGCVISLLEKGYSPRHIELEKTWMLGHGESGRLDILIRDPSGSLYAMIECKTAGSEYTKARNKMLEEGGQLFSYFQQDRSAKALYLYSSHVKDTKLTELAEFVRCEPLTGTNMEELHESWGGTLESSGIFHPSAGLYDDEFRGITKVQLKDLTRDTGQGVFHSFAEVLRRHVVSDKPNAFNKIFNLFLCKIADEDEKSDDDEMDFQWRFGDTGEALIERIGRLYTLGLSEYLRVTTEPDYHFKLNEFAFVDVFNKKTFDHNVTILREIVELLQNYRVKYSARHQYLGDFFEMLLSTGIKQEAGQFFTPVPLARAVIRALPIGKIIESKISAGKADILPFIVDFACGAGHFLTEAIQEIHEVSNNIDITRLSSRARTRFQRGREAYGWASEFIFGIEKDHRLAKVTKIATFLNGDGDANIVHADGLAPFSATSGYPPLLVSGSSRQLNAIDIVVANPPFSVANFRRDVEDGAERFHLYKHLSADSSEIECLFLERASQMLVDGGVAGIFFPLSLLGNSRAIYKGARRILAVDFQICGLIELRNKTFIATPTTTVCCFLKKRSKEELVNAANNLIRLTPRRKEVLKNGGVDIAALELEREALPTITAQEIIEGAYEKDILAHAIRIMADGTSETIVSFSGDSVQDQEAVLGYRFSKSRGTEGYTVFEKDGIPQTLLYDPECLTNQGTFSGAVLARMEDRPLDIPEDPEVSKFLLSVPSNDIWSLPNSTIENPSSFFITEQTVESASPYGDFIDALDHDKQTVGIWLDEERVVMVRGVQYRKSDEMPRQTATRILTASNVNLNTRKITLQQYRYLADPELVDESQRPVVGDIVICTNSGSLKHLGKIACVQEPIDAYIGGFLGIFRCPDPIDRKILEYNFLSLRFRQLMATLKEQNINNLTTEKLRTFVLHVPRNRDSFMDEVERCET